MVKREQKELKKWYCTTGATICLQGGTTRATKGMHCIKIGKRRHISTTVLIQSYQL
jgi:hypothetical protein